MSGRAHRSSNDAKNVKREVEQKDVNLCLFNYFCQQTYVPIFGTDNPKSNEISVTLIIQSSNDLHSKRQFSCDSEGASQNLLLRAGVVKDRADDNCSRTLENLNHAMKSKDQANRLNPSWTLEATGNS